MQSCLYRYVSNSVDTYISCNTEHTSTVIFMTCTIISCYPRVLITCGKGTICADKELKDAMKRNLMPLSQKVKMLNRLDKGMIAEAVGSHHGVNK